MKGDAMFKVIKCAAVLAMVMVAMQAQSQSVFADERSEARAACDAAYDAAALAGIYAQTSSIVVAEKETDSDAGALLAYLGWFKWRFEKMLAAPNLYVMTATNGTPNLERLDYANWLNAGDVDNGVADTSADDGVDAHNSGNAKFILGNLDFEDGDNELDNSVAIAFYESAKAHFEGAEEDFVEADTVHYDAARESYIAALNHYLDCTAIADLCAARWDGP